MVAGFAPESCPTTWASLEIVENYFRFYACLQSDPCGRWTA